MLPAESWHLPVVFKYMVGHPATELNVVFLQRMAEHEQQQVKQALETIDEAGVQSLDIAQTLKPRWLNLKVWIRDYPATSGAAILEIAKAALHDPADRDLSLESLIFVDSAWDLGNVIAAHWEKDDNGEPRLMAARVPAGIANVLLTSCDQVEGLTLSHALGYHAFQESRVDFYKDIKSGEAPDVPENEWPQHLPSEMGLEQTAPVIISLRTLGADAMEELKREINAGPDDDTERAPVYLYNWQGPEPRDRLVIRDIYNIMRRRSELSSDSPAFTYAWFVDYMLQGPNGEPRILSVSEIPRDPHEGVQIIPVDTPEFLSAWEAARNGKSLEEEHDYISVFEKEHCDHLNTANPGDPSSMKCCPVFFLHPFSPAKERQIRARICAEGKYDTADMGKTYIWHGYVFDDGKEHTLEDLRDFFERSDPWSPFFDEANAKSYRLSSYPGTFVAVDKECLKARKPKVWMGSTLDFSGDDTSDELGWFVGRVAPEEVESAYVNLDIANMGPEDLFDQGTSRKLWLSDLTAYRAEDWEEEEEDEGGLEGEGEQATAEANEDDNGEAAETDAAKDGDNPVEVVRPGVDSLGKDGNGALTCRARPGGGEDE